MKKFFLKWILIGLLIRLVVMPFTYHPDIRAFDFGAYLISQKGEALTFYDYLTRLDQKDPLLKNYSLDYFIYPPLGYLIPGAFMAILSPFYNFNFNDIFLRNIDEAFRNPEFYKTLFLLKVPYLLFDFLLAYILFLVFKGQKGKAAFKLWMLNPITLYATFAIGQIEIFPTLALVAAVWLALEDRKKLAVIILGIGGAFKLFPLLILPIFVLVLEKKLAQRVKLFFLGALPYLLIIAPYFLFSPMYRVSAFLAGQTQKMFFMRLPVSGAEGLPIFALGYFALLFYASHLVGKKEFLWKFSLALLLLFFAVTHYHPQWFLWVTPFFIWDFATYGKRHLPYLVILSGCYLLIVMFFESSLHIGLLSPLNPDLLKIGSLSEALGRVTDIFLFKSLIRSLFAVAAAFLALDVFKDKADEAL